EAARDLLRVELAAQLGAVVARSRRHPRRLAAVVGDAARVRAADLARLARRAARVALVAPPVLVGGVRLRAVGPAAIAGLLTELARRGAARGFREEVLAVLTADRPARTRAARDIALHGARRAERARHVARAGPVTARDSARAGRIRADLDAVAAAALAVR